MSEQLTSGDLERIEAGLREWDALDDFLKTERKNLADYVSAADVLAFVAALREAWSENALILQRLSSVYSGVLEDIEKLPPDSDFKYLYTSFLRDMQMWVRQYPSIMPDRSAASDEATGGGGDR